MLLKLLSPLLAIIGISAGISELKAAYSQPLQTSCAEFSRTRPDARALKLTGCRLDLLGGANRVSRIVSFAKTLQGKEAVGTLYVPLLPADADESVVSSLVLETKDARLRTILEELGTAPDEASAIAALDLRASELKALLQPSVVEGLAKDPVSERIRSNLPTKVADGALVLVHNQRPDTGLGWFMIAVGLGFGGLFASSVLPKSRKDPATEELLAGVEPQLGELEQVRREQAEAERANKKTGA
ncbi:MAG: hypothetical protein HY901_36605 [Deltaproteobacteria bacterium]|nr:hypothetical protein [Deltaproteobacteria bacterium]